LVTHRLRLRLIFKVFFEVLLTSLFFNIISRRRVLSECWWVEFLIWVSLLVDSIDLLDLHLNFRFSRFGISLSLSFLNNSSYNWVVFLSWLSGISLHLPSVMLNWWTLTSTNHWGSLPLVSWQVFLNIAIKGLEGYDPVNDNYDQSNLSYSQRWWVWFFSDKWCFRYVIVRVWHLLVNTLMSWGVSIEIAITDFIHFLFWFPCLFGKRINRLKLNA